MAKIVSFPKKLLWSHIREMYPNEWVELVDCDFHPGSDRPVRGLVRNHASDRSDLLKKISVSGVHPRSIILFVGFTHSVVSFEVAGAAA